MKKKKETRGLFPFPINLSACVLVWHRGRKREREKKVRRKVNWVPSAFPKTETSGFVIAVTLLPAALNTQPKV